MAALDTLLIIGALAGAAYFGIYYVLPALQQQQADAAGQNAGLTVQGAEKLSELYNKALNLVPKGVLPNIPTATRPLKLPTLPRFTLPKAPPSQTTIKVPTSVPL